MTTVQEIANLLRDAVVFGDPSVAVPGLTLDSRKIVPGWMFVAMPGEKADGHSFIADAVRRSAGCIMAEHPRSPQFEPIPWIQVHDARKVLGPVAAMLCGDPTRELTLIGVTGTNGKTTVTYLVESILAAHGAVPGVVGTVEYRWKGARHDAARTTPEASDLQALFRAMRSDGVTHVVMEVSSHGLHRHRLDGCHFDVGVFTNLTQDHLDYHGNFEEYFRAKQILFDRLLPESCKAEVHAIVNIEDPYGERLARSINAIPVISMGLGPECAVHPLDAHFTPHGISATVKTPRGALAVEAHLAGPFNLANMLTAIAIAEALKIPVEAVVKGIGALTRVPGRLERVPSDVGTIFVDYAHSPDALKTVLAAIQKITTGRIITIMGCGGDRDTAKRPLMGMEAAGASDFVVVTSDNPRSEDPQAIIDQVVEGIVEAGYQPLPDHLHRKLLPPGYFMAIPDRREAITWALSHLQPNDVLLVAGKGHETYQEINGVKHPFDDREVVREGLRKLSTGGVN
ncbi:MAG: UDP-N-acetylmuramoyl-L-alanyl-D-glutamate--2,6-diaminopimelate ligase [Thermodesulfobacteriota bacterium]